jgi:carnitine-CoA ligase
MNETPNVVLAALVYDQSERYPDLNILTFVTIAEDNTYQEETRTYLQLYQNGQALARRLRTLGIGVNDNVALMMNNHPEFVDSMVGASIIGATIVPVDPRTVGAKLSYMIDFTECKGIICADYCVEAVLGVVNECKALRWVIIVRTIPGFVFPRTEKLSVLDWRDIQAGQGNELPVVQQSMDEPMALLFTSGTTGNPKAVVQTMPPTWRLLQATNSLASTTKIYFIPACLFLMSMPKTPCATALRWRARRSSAANSPRAVFGIFAAITDAPCFVCWGE